MDDGDFPRYGPMDLLLVSPSGLTLNSGPDDNATMIEPMYWTPSHNKDLRSWLPQRDSIEDLLPLSVHDDLGTTYHFDGLTEFDIPGFRHIPELNAMRTGATSSHLPEQSFAIRNPAMVDTQLSNVPHSLGHLDSSVHPTIDLPQQSLTFPVRSRYPNAEDWEFYRTTITQLYLEENRTLKDLKAIMKDTYGFDATDKMYNSRINAWQLFKNQKAAEKERVAQYLEAHKKLGVDLGAPMIRGREIKEHKIARHLTQKRKRNFLSSNSASLEHDEPLDTSYATLDNARSRKRARKQRSIPCHAISFSRINDPAEYRNAENVLVQIDQYFSSKLGGDPLNAWDTWMKSARQQNRATRIRYTYQSRAYISIYSQPWDLYNQFHGAAVRLGDRSYSQEGWKMIHGGAEMIRSCFQQESPNFLGTFFILLDNPGMERHPEVLDLLLRLLTGMAACIYGESHPIAMTCNMLQTFRERKQIVHLAKKKLFDTLVHYLGKDHRDSLLLQADLARDGRTEKTPDENMSAARGLAAYCESTRGRNDFLTRQSLLEMALMCIEYSEPSESSEAWNLLIDVLERCETSGKNDHIFIRACQALSIVSQRCKDYDSTEKFQWKALSTSLYRYGPLDSITNDMHFTHKLNLRERRAGEKASEHHAQLPNWPSDTPAEPGRSFSRRRANSLPSEYSLGCPCENRFIGHAQTQGLLHHNSQGKCSRVPTTHDTWLSLWLRQDQVVR